MKKRPRRHKPVQVTASALPDKAEYLKLVGDILESGWLTNQGAICRRLEGQLTQWLGADYLSLCANGTLGLQMAIRMLGLSGKKVITTPFTYVATLSALLWEGCQPVFADIDPQSLCLSPEKTEEQLRKHPDVAGLLPVHVFGNACAVEELGEIARKHGLKILYDAAHAFGSQYKGQSLLNFGDAAMCSFHATKLFHTIEGGCVISHQAEDAKKIGLLRAYGHVGDTHYSLGLNAKLSEVHAAMGLCLLPRVPHLLAAREKLAQKYDARLQDERLARPKLAPGLQWNHAYYPVILPDENSLLRVMAHFKDRDIFPRRYFYPSLTQLPYLRKQEAPISDDISRRILCLPFWADMPEVLLDEIAELLLEALAA